MNIFFVDKDPSIAGHCLHDVHCNKMILEAGQLLSNVHHITGYNFPNLGRYVIYRNDPFKPTHLHHPCTLWLLESRDNYSWLSQYLKWLCLEFSWRRGKNHKVAQFSNYFQHNQPSLPATNSMTLPKLCMPDHYQLPSVQTLDDVVTSYRQYYIGDKWQDKNGKRIDKWSMRSPPHWWITPEERGIV